MLTTPYSLKSDYNTNNPVSASDLNRRARVLASQLPGALRGSALCAGVLPLWNPSDELPLADLVADLVERAGESLRVSISGSLFVVGAGAAFVPLTTSAGAPLIYTQTQGLSNPVQGAEDGTTLYIHLALTIPTVTETSSSGITDSQLGSPPELRLSEIEQEPGALLLASYTDSGGLKDRRTFVAPVLLAREMEALSKRLDALNAPVTSGGNGAGELTVAKFLALQSRVELIEGAFADIRAQIARLNAGANPFPAPFDILADEIALTRAGLAELSPPSIERGQISVIGAGFGHAQNSTPDYTPDTHDPLELPFDPLQGLFAP